MHAKGLMIGDGAVSPMSGVFVVLFVVLVYIVVFVMVVLPKSGVSASQLRRTGAQPLGQVSAHAGLRMCQEAGFWSTRAERCVVENELLKN